MDIAAEINQRGVHALLPQIVAHPVGDIAFRDGTKIDLHSRPRKVDAAGGVIEDHILSTR